jgi:protein phosphatase
MSLEVICTLMALKMKFPDQVYLLRGEHEDASVNLTSGFADECRVRLADNPADKNSVFSTINRFFAWLPFAAVVDDRILCVHGGIGATLQSIDDIEYIPRPITLDQAKGSTKQLLLDLLWSDPIASSDLDQTVVPSNRREGVFKFGSERLN